jgi:phosphate uptake regulator
MATELREEDPQVLAQVNEGLREIERSFVALLERGRADRSLGRGLDVRATARLLTGVVVAARTLSRVGAQAELIDAMVETGRRALA